MLKLIQKPPSGEAPSGLDAAQEGCWLTGFAPTVSRVAGCKCSPGLQAKPSFESLVRLAA